MLYTTTPACWQLPVLSAGSWTTAVCSWDAICHFSVVLLTQCHWFTFSSTTTFSVHHPSILSIALQPTSSLFLKATPAVLPYKSSSCAAGLAKLSWRAMGKKLLKSREEGSRGRCDDFWTPSFSEAVLNSSWNSCAAHIKSNLELMTCTPGHLPRE